MNEKIQAIAARFMRYVQIDTEADPNSDTFPSSEKQKNLGKLLAQELTEMGLTLVEFDKHGYVYASIPATKGKENCPVICFCSHMDTAPDCSGKDIKPIYHSKYDGADIVLPNDITQVITTQMHPYLTKKIGDDLITASGKTLLGADDKAGVAIIMEFALHLLQNPKIEHGKISILFTPDEEIGRGVDFVDMQKVGANFGYTLDGGEEGSFECDTFSADAMSVTFHGIAAHPGYAKNKMINAQKVAAHFMGLLPKDTWSPETTYNREGFVHPISSSGTMEQATIKFIVRSFDTAELTSFEEKLTAFAQQASDKYKGAKFETVVTEQYRNMREILDKNPTVMELAEKAIINMGIELDKKLVRGGTDGSRLSFMGLPCPNIFTGEMAIHSKHEFVSVQDMEKAKNVCVEIARLNALNN